MLFITLIIFPAIPFLLQYILPYFQIKNFTKNYIQLTTNPTVPIPTTPSIFKSPTLLLL
ncbi:transcriptional regulator GutM, partial [Staphylococcus epidermidis]|uniref:transcriptional regulator GutM n=1 Tax=Staphylococcus epidermidis TaxID=1282 RepID=UPI001C930534